MKPAIRTICVLASALLVAGCAIGTKLGWQRGQEKPTAVVQASCDAATATLKGRPDHDVAYEACVEAKLRQNVD